MEDGRIDALDRQVLGLLQSDCRATLTEMAEGLPVSGNTVSNRIRELEAAAVIQGYTVLLDYAKVDRPFRWLFTCTAAIAERHRLGELAADVPGVVEVLELMTGEGNLVVQAVGRDRADIKRIAVRLDELGLHVVDETLVDGTWRSPVDLSDDDERSDAVVG